LTFFRDLNHSFEPVVDIPIQILYTKVRVLLPPAPPPSGVLVQGKKKVAKDTKPAASVVCVFQVYWVGEPNSEMFRWFLSQFDSRFSWRDNTFVVPFRLDGHFLYCSQTLLVLLRFFVNHSARLASIEPHQIALASRLCQAADTIIPHLCDLNIGFSLPTEPRDTPSLLSVTVPSLQCSVKGPSLLFEPRERVYLRYNYVLTAPIRALLLELCLGTPDPNSCTYAGVPDQEFHDYFNNRENGLVTPAANPLSRSRAEMIALLQGGTPIAPVVTAAAVAPSVPPSQEQIGAVDPTGALNQADA
jgi:hypothetical protein